MPKQPVRVPASAFNPQQVQFGPLRKYPDKQQPYIPATYRSTDNGHVVTSTLQLITPSMPMPFGVGSYEGAKNIDLSFNDPTPEVQSFRDKMSELDNLVLQAAQAHAEAFFGEVPSIEVLKHTQNKIAKQAKKKEYGYSMKIKWPKFEGPTFWKQAPGSGKFVEVSEDECKPGCTGKVVAELRPIYSVNGRFGVKWVVIQVLVETFPAQPDKCAFGDVASQGDPAAPKAPTIHTVDENDMEEDAYEDSD